MSWFTRRGIELVPSDLTSYSGWIADMRQAHSTCSSSISRATSRN